VNYSQASISNLALGRIGARGQIVSINDNSPNAVKVLAVWDAVFQEVLSERDWKFAKTRAQLQLSTVTPLYSYRYAWALPADLLRFVRPIKKPHDRQHYWLGWGPEGTGWYRREDPPFWPFDTDYKVETLTSGWTSPLTDPPTPFPPPFPIGRYAITNYGGWMGSAMITYIQLITDYTQLMPGFVNCLANRLAMELSIGVTEDKQKFEMMQQAYKDSLNSAEAQNECLDFSEDESGSTSWEDAGRYVRFW
jgi:hypothetical protein